MIEPPMKLEPTIKLTGNSTVLSISKLTLLLLELFCIPIISKKNKQKLNVDMKNNFFNIKSICLTIFLDFNSNYKFRFYLFHFFLLGI